MDPACNSTFGVVTAPGLNALGADQWLLALRRGMPRLFRSILSTGDPVYKCS